MKSEGTSGNIEVVWVLEGSVFSRSHYLRIFKLTKIAKKATTASPVIWQRLQAFGIFNVSVCPAKRTKGVAATARPKFKPT